MIKILNFVLLFVILFFQLSLCADIATGPSGVFSANSQSPSVGVQLDLPDFRFGDKFGLSFGYSLSTSKDSLYSSAPAMFGVGVIFLAISSSDDDDDDSDDPADDDDDDDDDSSTNIMGALGLLLVLVPENVKFIYRIDSKSECALGVHPWGFDYDYSEKEFYYSNGLSLHYKRLLSQKMYVSPYASFRYLYALDRPVFDIGLYLGYAF